MAKVKKRTKRAEPGRTRAKKAGSASTDRAPAEARPRKRRATAESMAAAQRDISVSEFFAKNRHLLGFDNPQKALLTAVQEAVDNSLDASEEAGILPDPETELRRFRTNIETLLDEREWTGSYRQLHRRLKERVEEVAARDPAEAMSLVRRLPLYAERLLAPPPEEER